MAMRSLAYTPSTCTSLTYESSSWLWNRASESGLRIELRIELANRASGFRIELQAFESSFRLAN